MIRILVHGNQLGLWGISEVQMCEAARETSLS